jgi:transitional endoplasmic reticulum ATPase
VNIEPTSVVAEESTKENNTVSTNTTAPANVWSKKAAEENTRRAVDFLEEIGGGRVTAESAFEWRTDTSHRIALPSKPEQMSLETAAMMLSKQAQAEKEMYEFTRTFQARPYDGAYAFDVVVKEVFGMTAIGKAIHSMFGTQPPQYQTVNISPTETVQVPWGLLEFPPLEAQFMLRANRDEDYGLAFAIQVTAPKKHRVKIDGLFALIEARLKKASIYRNKALIGVGKLDRDGSYREPVFFNPYEVDREKVVYAKDVFDALYHSVWGRIANADKLREANVGLGNKVLLHGENGTGKTLAAAITAQFCLEHGWSMVQARWDEDLKQVVKFAELIGVPCAVVIEDIEKLIQRDPKEMDALLDLFDGIGAKNREVMLLMTSNHVNELTKSMTRAGRIDRMIYVSDLDREGVERLINALIPASQREQLDYEKLHEAYEGYTPSWIVEALKNVKVASIIRTGEVGQALATEDFVVEANALRPAWERHSEATDRPAKDVMGEVLTSLVADTVNNILDERYVDMEEGAAKILVDA